MYTDELKTKGIADHKKLEVKFIPFDMSDRLDVEEHRKDIWNSWDEDREEESSPLSKKHTKSKKGSSNSLF